MLSLATVPLLMHCLLHTEIVAKDAACCYEVAAAAPLPLTCMCSLGMLMLRGCRITGSAWQLCGREVDAGAAACAKPVKGLLVC